MLTRCHVIIVILAFLLSACDPVARVPVTPTAIVGTRMVIKENGVDRFAEVIRVEDKLVSIEVKWRGERDIRLDYYRGLLQVAGSERDLEYELDFDKDVLERFFPLAVDTRLDFSSRLRLLSRGVSFPAEVQMKVSGERTIELSSGEHKVFVVDITTLIGEGDEQRVLENSVYYDPELSIILKDVRRTENGEQYWYVTSVEQPGSPRQPTLLQQRRSGTIMI